MTGLFASALIAASLALAVFCIAVAALNRRPRRIVIVGVGIIELMLLAFLIGGIAQMIASDRDFARLEFVAYLLGLVVIPPLALVWGLEEKSRTGMIVIAIALVVVPIMIVRTQQVWAGA